MSNLTADNAELLAYGRKMLERGDSWRSIRSYLVKTTNDETRVNEIIKTLSIMEREGHITQQKDTSKTNRQKLNLLLGLTLIGSGVFLFSFLWYSGWVAGLPILLIAAGLIVIIGGNPASIFKRP